VIVGRAPSLLDQATAHFRTFARRSCHSGPRPGGAEPVSAVGPLSRLGDHSTRTEKQSSIMHVSVTTPARALPEFDVRLRRTRLATLLGEMAD
jgi:hypothetical protein